MPQGTWLGPYVFLVLIDDLHKILDKFKFVDDVTMVEIIDQTAASSQMQTATNQLAAWSERNFLNVNTRKTKAMLLGPILLSPLSQIAINNGVQSFN
jgi:hypothetical protein